MPVVAHERKSRPPTVASFAREWFRARTNRSAQHEERLWANHIAKRWPWFLRLRLLDVRTAHVGRLVAEVKAAYVGPSGKVVRLSGKSVNLVFGVVRLMFRDARIGEKMRRNPFEQLPRRTFAFRTKRRAPYTADEVRRLITDDRLAPIAHMMMALLFYTGMREGEVCGRRIRDWERAMKPLGALHVGSQYDGRPLKTEKAIGDAPCIVPVHPELAAVLEEWWTVGFGQQFGRSPGPDDFIVPVRRKRGMGCHSRSSAYKMFRRAARRPACPLARCTRRERPSSRSPAVAALTRGGFVRVTHNDRGDVFDGYVASEWEPMCEAVSCFLRRPVAMIPVEPRPLARAPRNVVDVDIHWIHPVHRWPTTETSNSGSA
jgi:integrase